MYHSTLFAQRFTYISSCSDFLRHNICCRVVSSVLWHPTLKSVGAPEIGRRELGPPQLKGLGVSGEKILYLLTFVDRTLMKKSVEIGVK